MPGVDRNAVLNVGLKFHPKGYKPTRPRGEGIQIGSTELDVRPDQPQPAVRRLLGGAAAVQAAELRAAPARDRHADVHRGDLSARRSRR